MSKVPSRKCKANAALALARKNLNTIVGMLTVLSMKDPEAAKAHQLAISTSHSIDDYFSAETKEVDEELSPNDLFYS